MTLSTRIVALVLLALVPAIAVQTFNEHALRTAREDAVRASALRGAQAVTDDLTKFAAGTRQVLDILAEAPAIRDRDPAGCIELLRAAVGKLSGATILLVVDAQGMLVCNSRGAGPGAYSIADRNYFRTLMTTGSFVIGEYVVGRGSLRPTFQLAVPLTASGSTDPTGAIVVGLDPQWLGARLAQTGLPNDASLTVIDRNGVILARSPDAAVWVGQAPTAAFHEGLYAAAAEGGVTEMPGLRGDLSVMGVLNPDGALDGMTVVVGLSRKAAFADIDAATRRGAILILGGILIAVAAALIAGRAFIRRPVRHLLRASKIWRSGDLSARSGLAGASEFGQLGQAFDSMAAALQKHESDLQAELGRSRALQEQQVTMLHELNHRVKNTLATVQSLARQSKGGEAEVMQLEGRILALSKTHDLLTRDDWTGAPLRAVLENELGPYRSGSDHVALDGPDVDLPPRYVLALGMTAHELTTNAAKYGALSTSEGRIAVTWRTVPDGEGGQRLQIDWQEEGGPSVAPPQRRGFGTRLITGGIARELSGEVRLHFEPEGLRCAIDVPLEAAHPVMTH
jgi:two-component sensor histidine kinase